MIKEVDVLLIKLASVFNIRRHPAVPTPTVAVNRSVSSTYQSKAWIRLDVLDQHCSWFDYLDDAGLSLNNTS